MNTVRTLTKEIKKKKEKKLWNRSHRAEEYHWTGKKILEGFNNRVDEAEERIDDLYTGQLNSNSEGKRKKKFKVKIT